MSSHAVIRLRRIGICLLSLVAILIATLAFFRIRGPNDLEAFRGMADECHPVWKSLALRRISRGDSVTNLFALYKPSQRAEFGRYGIYDYYKGGGIGGFTGLRIIARDGHLISAASGSCTWQFVFFRTVDADLDKQYVAYEEQRLIEWERRRLGRMEVCLQEFYSQYARWPVNPKEFSLFVNGSLSYTTNDLEVVLREGPGGAEEISLVRLPDETRLVKKPEHSGQTSP